MVFSVSNFDRNTKQTEFCRNGSHLSSEQTRKYVLYTEFPQNAYDVIFPDMSSGTI